MRELARDDVVQRVSFCAVGLAEEETTYSLEFTTCKAVDEAKCTWSVKPREVVFVLVKKEKGRWGHLLPADQHMNNLHVDWAKWDEED